jgi:hypothetical protein
LAERVNIDRPIHPATHRMRAACQPRWTGTRVRGPAAMGVPLSARTCIVRRPDVVAWRGRGGGGGGRDRRAARLVVRVLFDGQIYPYRIPPTARGTSPAAARGPPPSSRQKCLASSEMSPPRFRSAGSSTRVTAMR